MLAGDYSGAFRWSHALHVPFLGLAHRLAGGLFGGDILRLYQHLDIVLGSIGLALLYLIVRRFAADRRAPMTACALVLLSWGFWSEAVVADEKMAGFLLAVTFCHLLLKLVVDEPESGSRRAVRNGVVLGLVLALAILMHASSVLLAPAAAVILVRKRAFRVATALALSCIAAIAATYAVILVAFDAGRGDGLLGYFSAGVTSYSVLATGLRGAAWLREIVQGVTKVIWAVFSEDGMRRGQLLAVATGGLAAAVGALAWRVRRDRSLDWVHVLLAVTGAFGLTYAPSAPDSYMLALVPLAVYATIAMRTRPGRAVVLGLLCVAVLNNGAHYWSFARQSGGDVDAGYQRAVRSGLRDGDVLVVLDAVTGVASGTQTIMPIHQYWNPGLTLLPSSGFLADPSAPAVRALAESGRLHIEGICFESFATRGDADISRTGTFGALAQLYDLRLAVPFDGYSNSYHRRYKGIYNVSPRESDQRPEG